MASKFSLFFLLFCFASALSHQSAEQIVQGEVKLEDAATVIDPIKPKPGKSIEDSIPVIEVRGEGKPMSAAQIRALEEETEGKPLDIKVKNTWVPKSCPRKAQRKDFITFHYKGFFEDQRKFDQTYGRDPLRIQLGVGMTMPGLDKGLKGMCDTELRKITVPWRLSRKKKSKVWKYVPNEEHWIVFDIEMLKVEGWTPELQFHELDTSNDTKLTFTELANYLEKVRKDFGKHLPNEEIDNVHLSKYFIAYFDQDNDMKVSKQEYIARMEGDLKEMKQVKRPPIGRKRDPGVGWVLDFNNDGIVDQLELDAAPTLLEKGPEHIKEYLKKTGGKVVKDEL